MPHVFRNENPNYYDPESTLVIDSRGLFDALDNDLLQDDRKSALEVLIIEESHASRTLSASLVSTQSECSRRHDKVQSRSISEPLFNLLRTGKCTLKSEKNELADRAAQRRTGTVPLHKVECDYRSGVKALSSSI